MARDCANAKGEAEPAEAPPKERSGTEEGTPSAGMSGAPNGGWNGMSVAAIGAEGWVGADHGAGGEAGTAGEPAGAPPVMPRKRAFARRSMAPASGMNAPAATGSASSGEADAPAKSGVAMGII